MPGIAVCALQILTESIFKPPYEYFDYPHFLDEETKVQKGKVPFSKPSSYYAERGLVEVEPMYSSSRVFLTPAVTGSLSQATIITGEH